MSIRFLSVPGLAGSGPTHWQTIWEKQYPGSFRRAEQENWDWPVMEVWVDKLNEYIQNSEKSVILVAHSLGCITVAHWANKYSSPKVSGALLVAPADADLSKRLSFVEGFAPIPLKKLQFKSVVVASTNDIYASIDRSKAFAEFWGSEFVNVGKKGHINAVSGLEDWSAGKDLLSNLSGIELL
jgi:predicted alpha/beta hydrolase family esterase